MKKKRLLSALLTTVVAAGLLAGCGKVKENNSTNIEKITVTDRKGEIEVPKNPERVVVLDYGTLDVLEEIGVDNVVGVPKSGLPEYLNKYEDEKYTDVGGVKEFNFETINELNPDLIIIEGRQEDSLEELSKIAPTVFLGSVGSDYLNSVKNNSKVIGQIFDKEKEVKTQVAKVEEAIGKVNEKAEGVNALIALANDNAFSVYGEGSRFGIIHKEFGIEAVDKTIESSTHGQKASFEYILDKNPDYLFVIDRAAVTGGNTSAKEMFDNEIIKKTDAYKNGNIVYLDADVWYTISGGIESTQKMVDEVLEALK